MAEMMWWTQSLIRCSRFKTQFGAFRLKGFYYLVIAQLLIANRCKIICLS